MSDLVFPSLPGLAWNVVRTPIWQTRTQTSVSGREVRQADWSYPRYGWELNFDFLRSDPSYGELQTLIGFINQMQGGFGTFLYTDEDDNAVNGQQIGTGDSVTVKFPLIRSFGSFIEPIGRLNSLSGVAVGGVNTVPTINYDDGTESGSSLSFATPPVAGAEVVASFTYYWRCRFSADTTEFTKFLHTACPASRT